MPGKTDPVFAQVSPENAYPGLSLGTVKSSLINTSELYLKGISIYDLLGDTYYIGGDGGSGGSGGSGAEPGQYQPSTVENSSYFSQSPDTAPAAIESSDDGTIAQRLNLLDSRLNALQRSTSAIPSTQERLQSFEENVGLCNTELAGLQQDAERLRQDLRALEERFNNLEVPSSPDQKSLSRSASYLKDPSAGEQSVKGSVARFADDEGKELEDTAAWIDDSGSIDVHSVFARATSAILSGNGGHTLLGVDPERSCITLGSQSINLRAGDGALANIKKDAVNLIAIGQDSLSACEHGKNNVAMGAFSLAHFLGSEQVAIGSRALMRAVETQGCSAVGYSALSNNREGHFCTAFGHRALERSLGSAMTGIGAGCFLSAESATGCCGVGAGAGDKVVRAKNVTCLGDASGPDGDYANTISIGKGAKALNSGDLALGSPDAPLKTSGTATSSSLCILNPAQYLHVTLNGKRYKLALYAV